MRSHRAALLCMARLDDIHEKELDIAGIDSMPLHIELVYGNLASLHLTDA